MELEKEALDIIVHTVIFAVYLISIKSIILSVIKSNKETWRDYTLFQSLKLSANAVETSGVYKQTLSLSFRIWSLAQVPFTSSFPIYAAKTTKVWLPQNKSMKYDSAIFSFSIANNAKKLPNLLHVLLKR